MQPADSLNLLGITGLLVGGLALFLFGLELMTGGLKAIAGARLQSLLGTLTASRLRGVLAGAGVTALLNSSTITTVLLVGFVSAGLMTLGQSIPMIMGANVGSTLTAQIIAFNVSAVTPFMLAAGFLLHAFARRELLRQLGGVVLGLGLLFLGIEFMGDATRPLRSFQPFIDAMQDMRSPLLGIVIGAVFTAIVQSSAATLAIVIALGSQGLIPLEAGIALILGANVGTCGTALLAAIGKPPEAAQVGIVHLLFNVLGVLFFAFVIPQFADFIRMISPSAPELQGAARLAAETPRQAANAHAVFSVASTLVLIWFSGPIGTLAQRIVPSRPSPWRERGEPRYLDETLLDMPALGIGRVQLELLALGEQTLELVRQGAQAAIGGGTRDIATLTEQDSDADHLGLAVLQYVGRLSDADLTEVEGQQIVSLTRIATCLESIREVASTSMIAASQRRLAEGIELEHLRSEDTANFASAVLDCLAQSIGTIGQPLPGAIASVVGAKAEIEALADAARQSVASQLRLRSRDEVISFRLSNDMIEQFLEIARMSRAMARATRCLQGVRSVP
ncbi:hypothetical protein LMG31506_02612 [Cupriavidus yeoncheonensis]|uniref:Na/Pi cotransporter family protein n=1 Tax=Cupriavidus yeoncheonensis TaxID=1462994 RepID=A0A916ITU1_9BURK|nr:Na/Pi cotransporter family protein [Cupriavidus yeoncheonensis]CAG2142113.1 hypothetical protein LMG31506_02612 [Cupriavidus yeoncheonensis]